MQLSKSGYGTINELLQLKGSKFMNLVHYEKFLNKFETVIKELNKNG